MNISVEILARRSWKRRVRALGIITIALGCAMTGAVPGVDAQPSAAPIWGFADLHNHQFAYLGFGGLVMWGAAFSPENDIAKALPWSDFTPAGPFDVVDPGGAPVPLVSCVGLLPLPHCPATCPPGTGNPLYPCPGVLVHGPGGVNDLFNNFLSGSVGHLVGGYPEFDGWPRWNSYTGQQVYYEWLERAFRGGLRLMVMLAVNNEVLCKLSNRLVAFGCDDMPAVDRQLQAAKDLEQFIDNLNGGPGTGWYRIAYSARQAREIINSGKLAVVLGAEVPGLFGCKKNTSCTPEFVRSELDRYYEMGLRHVFPVHNADNAFGGTALYTEVFNFSNKIITGDYWDVGPCEAGSGIDFHLGLYDAINDAISVAEALDALPTLFSGAQVSFLTPLIQAAAADGVLPPRPPAGANCNSRGLTSLGQALVGAMMDKKMIVDVDHMSAKALNRTLEIAEARRYPAIVMGHTGFIENNQPHVNKKHEGNKTAAQVERVRRLGGLIAPILHQGTRAEITQYSRPDGQVAVPFDCGESSQAWAQAYLYAVERMKGAAVAVGSDFNGGAGVPAPRHGDEACHGDKPDDYAPGVLSEYPFSLHGQAGTMDRIAVGQKTFDYNFDGLAHVGMYPDFVHDLKTVGVSDDDLGPLFRSAEAYVRMWERAEEVKTSLDVDGNGSADASDGRIILRYLSGYPDSQLLTGVTLGSLATRTTSAAIRSYLDASKTLTPPMLDADGNGQFTAFTDGRLIYRYLSGIRDSALVAGSVIGAGATRSTAQAIAAYLDGFLPGVPASPASGALELLSTGGVR